MVRRRTYRRKRRSPSRNMRRSKRRVSRRVASKLRRHRTRRTHRKQRGGTETVPCMAGGARRKAGKGKRRTRPSRKGGCRSKKMLRGGMRNRFRIPFKGQTKVEEGRDDFKKQPTTVQTRVSEERNKSPSNRTYFKRQPTIGQTRVSEERNEARLFDKVIDININYDADSRHPHYIEDFPLFPESKLLAKIRDNTQYPRLIAYKLVKDTEKLNEILNDKIINSAIGTNRYSEDEEYRWTNEDKERQEKAIQVSKRIEKDVDELIKIIIGERLLEIFTDGDYQKLTTLRKKILVNSYTNSKK